MAVFRNPRRGQGITKLEHLEELVISDPSPARSLFQMCPVASVTPMINMPRLASRLGVGAVYLKDETDRMGLGSFKALGAVHAIARMALEKTGAQIGVEEAAEALSGETLVCASAGNHGLSVAAGSRIFGARAVVYVSETVSEEFAERLRRRGAEVMRCGANYEESMEASRRGAADNGWTLISDSSWPGYHEIPRRVMEGYLISGAEVIESMPEVPTHIVLQAGVGGFAASMTALFRSHWGDRPLIAIVEPESARCLTDSVLAGEPVVSPGPVSVMGRLDCKEASVVALARLARDADLFVTIEDDVAAGVVRLLSEHGMETTPSGAAGLAGVSEAGREVDLGESSRVLAFITEGPEDPS